MLERGFFKVTSWNVEHFDNLFNEAVSATTRSRYDRRMETIAAELRELDSDIFCILEGPRSLERIKSFCTRFLADDWQPVGLPAGEEYATRGTQYIWFLVRREDLPHFSLQSPRIWKEFAGARWPVHYWGEFAMEEHAHYRHPQILVLEESGIRVEFIGLHLKSKFVQRGKSDWEAGGTRQQDFIRAAIEARVKLTTEATNVRDYIERRFNQSAEPYIMVMGDLNDGPGKEYFENLYLYFDLISNIQGDIFFARRFLNHALFDAPDELRWTVDFVDFVQPERNPHILLDHILFTQAFVADDALLRIPQKAGLVEHAVHDRINAAQPSYAHTSDHRPVSVTVAVT